MNNNLEAGTRHSLHILTDLPVNDSMTQMDLSSRLGIASGLLNSLIRNLLDGCNID